LIRPRSSGNILLVLLWRNRRIRLFLQGCRDIFLGSLSLLPKRGRSSRLRKREINLRL
jgi:hypothetical protein